MFKIVTVIGARPQIIKAAALSRAIKNKYANKIQEIIVHTGQHYDPEMSEIFFKELGIPQPNYNLQVGSGSHGKQTALMISGIEEILETEKPGAIVLYGDTNSTLAGAIAASKIHVPVIHIEAGLRSFNKSMPEEVNRIMCDHVSTLLFSPTKTGFDNLVKEGFKENNAGPYHANNPRIYHCGDVMYDNSLFFSEVASSKQGIIDGLGLTNRPFVLATIHRNNNTDDSIRLNALFRAMLHITELYQLAIVLPLHPRTKKLLHTNLDIGVREKIDNNPLFHIIPPASFLEMVALEQNCKLVLTDSGGVQKEAFYFKKPCVILRPETEWIELVECGSAVIADADEGRILDGFKQLYQANQLVFPSFYGDGHAAEFICEQVLTQLAR